VSWVCPDLGQNTESTQETERSTGDGGVADIEVHGDLAAALEMDAPGRMEEPRELGEPVALAARRDRRELVPEVLRE
jgi:hypothetical protein